MAKVRIFKAVVILDILLLRLGAALAFDAAERKIHGQVAVWNGGHCLGSELQERRSKNLREKRRRDIQGQFGLQNCGDFLKHAKFSCKSAAAWNLGQKTAAGFWDIWRAGRRSSIPAANLHREKPGTKEPAPAFCHGRIKAAMPVHLKDSAMPAGALAAPMRPAARPHSKLKIMPHRGSSMSANHSFSAAKTAAAGMADAKTRMQHY